VDKEKDTMNREKPLEVSLASEIDVSVLASACFWQNLLHRKWCVEKIYCYGLRSTSLAYDLLSQNNALTWRFENLNAEFVVGQGHEGNNHLFCQENHDYVLSLIWH